MKDSAIHNTFAKFSNHHAQTVSTHAQLQAIQRNFQNQGHFKHVSAQRLSQLDDPSMNIAVMPEIAESVISQEEEDEFGIREVDTRRQHDSVQPTKQVPMISNF